MPGLVTADIHLTDNPRDEARWGLLPWMAQTMHEQGLSWAVILGDLTEAKDRHSGRLVNRFVDQLTDFPARRQIFLLRGNHDGLDPTNPFFHFVDYLPHVHFIGSPHIDEDLNALFLPCTDDWATDWKPYLENPPKVQHYFTHQTFVGALRENGTVADRGVPGDVFGNKVKVWSGDIHTPQKLPTHKIEYVGAPYRIDFGDTFTPRVVLLHENGSNIDFHFPCPSKHVLTISAMAELERLSYQEIKEKDQVKIRVALPRAEYTEWPRLQKEIEAWAVKRKVELYGPTLQAVEQKRTAKAEGKRLLPAAAVAKASAARGDSDELLAVGMSILEGVQ